MRSTTACMKYRRDDRCLESMWVAAAIRAIRKNARMTGLHRARMSLACNDGRLARASSAHAVASKPRVHAVQIEIDDGRGEERQHLAHQQAAHHGVAERLAQLRAGAVAQ